MVIETQGLIDALDAKREEAIHRCHICGGSTDEHDLCLSCERNASEMWTEQAEA